MLQSSHSFSFRYKLLHKFIKIQKMRSHRQNIGSNFRILALVHNGTPKYASLVSILRINKHLDCTIYNSFSMLPLRNTVLTHLPDFMASCHLLESELVNFIIRRRVVIVIHQHDIHDKATISFWSSTYLC
jgi:hypothetical protein